MSKIALSGNPAGSATYTIASPAGSTDRTLTLPDNTGTIITSASTTGIDASALSTGTVPTARLGSGTANNTTFLRGDQTWQTINATPTTDQVLTATAGASVGAVGTYSFLGELSNNAIRNPGATVAASSLRFVGLGGEGTPGAQAWDSQLRGADFVVMSGGTDGATPAGTWRLMGRQYNDTARATASVWLRIS